MHSNENCETLTHLEVEEVGLLPGGSLEVHFEGELPADLEERREAPVAEPVEDAPVEEGRRGRGLVLQAVLRGVHREHHVQVLHYLGGGRKEGRSQQLGMRMHLLESYTFLTKYYK